jgi:hypothetical protein
MDEEKTLSTALQDKESLDTGIFPRYPPNPPGG